MRPYLSVVIVSYQSQAHLERSLPALYAQNAPSFEVVLVDNCPGDGTAAWVRAHYPEVRVIPSPANTGYAGGNNLGFQHAQGRFVLVLNPDVWLHPGALEVLLRAAQTHPRALITPKLLNPDGTVNACGNQMHYTGITTCRGLGDPPQRYRGLHAVPLISGAAFITSREVLEALGGFDAAYFMYLEDTDLSLRARLLGFEVLCAADACATHAYTLGMNPRKFYYLERHRLLTLLKILEGRTLWRMLPALLLTEAAVWAFAFLRGPRYLAARLWGYAWLWRHRTALRAKRRVIQRSRRVSDPVLLGEALIALPFDQLVRSPGLARWLDRLTRPLYRWARAMLREVRA